MIADNVVGEGVTFVFDEGEYFCFCARGCGIMIYDGAKHFIWCRERCHLYRWDWVGLDRSSAMMPCCVSEGWKRGVRGGVE